MPARKASDEDFTRKRRRPATTPEGREQQLAADAFDLAEKQLRAGTASAQVISHFLKVGSRRERLEQMRLEHENELTKVKIEAMASQARVEELYKEALNAMRVYSGNAPAQTSDEFDD